MMRGRRVTSTDQRDLGLERECAMKDERKVFVSGERLGMGQYCWPRRNAV
jgi:hypothetical protein